MAKKGLGLPQTKGYFKLKGFTTGLKRENAYKAETLSTGTKKQTINLGVETKPDSQIYVTIQGMEQQDVYFGKRAEVKGQKGETIKVPWNKRKDPQPEGFELMGVKLGLEKGEDDKNIIKVLADFDASKEIKDKLQDGQCVFVSGDIEFSSFKKKDELVRNRRFNIKNLYLSNGIDFESPEFKESNDFKQKIIYMGIAKVDDKKDPRFEVEAKIVTYKTVEDATFVIRNVGLANTLRTELKPYTALDVWGIINNKIDTEEVEQKPKKSWGSDDSFKNTRNNYIRELVITGADPDSLDTDTYSEQIIEDAIRAYKEFGQSQSESKPKDEGSWGSKEGGSPVGEDDGSLPWD